MHLIQFRLCQFEVIQSPRYELEQQRHFPLQLLGLLSAESFGCIKKKKLSCVTARGAETMCQLNNDVHGEYMQGLISACIFTLRKSFTSIFHDVSDG